ncbi:hypothetical protein O181_004117 [Austropuccinia psidii MF-1]|uniref:Centrosomin N-terminal motif 1 domain-containing protein n=1 Tax=Austropuccinia psidii MF-1 TaxID=1389203 RepID=A0A9Q3BG52_9BASI|nr:hypothetical protein [Austropuccinia psidii MF-1]
MEHSILDDGTTMAHPDRTTGGISKLAGLTFGTDEDSFHSDGFDHQLENQLAVGNAPSQFQFNNKNSQTPTQKKSFKIKKSQTFNNDQSPNHSDDNTDSLNDTDVIMDEMSSYIKSKPGRNTIPTSSAPLNSIKKSKPASSLNPPQPSTSRSSNPPDTGLAEDSILNDSGAFALSPPNSPEIFKRNSGIINSNHQKKTPAARRALASEAIRGKGSHLTLREQEKVIDEVKKENFNLKLKIYFLEDRLAKLAPDQVDLALKENVEIKVEFQTVRQELKRYKRLLLEAERAIELAKAERDELLLRQSEDRNNNGLEAEVRTLKEELANKNKVTKNLEDELQRAKDRLVRLSLKENVNEVTSAFARDQRISHHNPINIQPTDDWAKEENLYEIKNLKNELTEERQLKENLLSDNQDLRQRLIETKNALHHSQDEVTRLHRIDEFGYRSSQISRAQSRLDDNDDYLGRRSLVTPISTLGSGQKTRDLRRDIDEMHKQIGELETENASLHSRLNNQVSMLSTRSAEKEKLQEQVNSLKRKILDLEDELDRGERDFENLQRRDDTHQGAADGLRDELNMYRDKLASALLTLEKKEKEIDELNAELQDRDNLYNQQIEKVAQELGSELVNAQAQRNELQELLDEREDQIEEVSEQLRDLINLQEETDKSLREVTRRLKEKEEQYNMVVEELETAQADLKDIRVGNRDLAVEFNENEHHITQLTTELEELEQEAASQATVHEQVVTKLKQKLNKTKSELIELTSQHEACLSEVKSLREKNEELSLRQAEVEERKRSEAESKRRLERNIDELERELRGAREEIELQIIGNRKEKRELQASFQQTLDLKQKSLSQAEGDLANVKGRLQVREEDLEKLQSVLKQLETESNRINQSQSNDRFSLELEIERLQRDLSSSITELNDSKSETQSVRNELRKVQLIVSTLNSEKEELKDKLEGVQKSRKELNEKFEEQTKNFRQAQSELAATKNRLQSLEDDITQEHHQLSKTENHHREQLSERNSLLLMTYQFIDKLINSGTVNRKSGVGVADAKPFSNFSVFHESLMNKLRSLSTTHSGFETKIKEVENKLEKQYAALKRQHDSRMRQLDQLETTIKAAADTQRQWRARLATKQGELETARETCNELQKQISSLKHRASMTGSSPGSITSQRQALSRVSNLEKRLLATQNQLKSTEEKFNEAKVKVSTVELSWQARLKELQERNRELEEKVKRERQGAKERKIELDQQVNTLKEQVETADKYGKELELIIKKQEPK